MEVIFYNIFLALFQIGIRIAAPFNGKAKKWLQGRKHVFERLEKAIPRDAPVIWMHCASLGEFEQGRPLLERLRTDFPRYKLLLTFFSPSGFEVQKNYAGADWVFYLPADGPGNARKFLEIVQPSLVIFVKYEFWYYYLKKIKYRNIPLLLVSALFRRDMSFFKWYGGLQRKMLSRFDHLFVQNAASRQLVDEIGLEAITSISGDTRFDRVAEIADKFEPIPVIENFTASSRVLVAGSTWREDEDALQAVDMVNDESLKLIIAPHEISPSHIKELSEQFSPAILFSNLVKGEATAARVLIIDNVGMLSRLYHYADIALIGGGFRKSGVHNVLEAAVYGKPVIFGPEYHKYSEAVSLVETGGGISVKDGEALRDTVRLLLSNPGEYRNCAGNALRYVAQNKGATQKILNFIQEKRLLTI